MIDIKHAVTSQSGASPHRDDCRSAPSSVSLIAWSRRAVSLSVNLAHVATAAAALAAKAPAASLSSIYPLRCSPPKAPDDIDVRVAELNALE